MEPRPDFHLTGTVVHGRGIGKLVGMPTANLDLPLGASLPPVGVYLTRALLEGREYHGVTNVGARPTVDRDPEITVEEYVLAGSWRFGSIPGCAPPCGSRTSPCCWTKSAGIVMPPGIFLASPSPPPHCTWTPRSI